MKPVGMPSILLTEPSIHHGTSTLTAIVSEHLPDSKVQGANMGPIWGLQDPGGPYDGPMNFALWAVSC